MAVIADPIEGCALQNPGGQAYIEGFSFKSITKPFRKAVSTVKKGVNRGGEVFKSSAKLMQRGTKLGSKFGKKAWKMGETVTRSVQKFQGETLKNAEQNEELFADVWMGVAPRMVPGLGGVMEAVKDFSMPEPIVSGSMGHQTTMPQATGSAMPSWALPAVIGGVGLLAVVLLRR